jgi:hypothetical protein
MESRAIPFYLLLEGSAMSDITVGSYVSFNGDGPFLVVDKGENLAKIATIKHQGKKQVAIRNLRVLPYKPAKVVTFEGNDYIVTGKLNIWSMKTGRLMQWKDCHRERQGILAAYDKACGNTPKKGVVYPSMKAYMRAEFGSDCE